MNEPHDTLRPHEIPPPDDAPAVMTCGQFKALLREMVADKLLEIHADIKNALGRLEDAEKKIGAHDLEIAEIKRELRALAARLEALEARG